MDMISGIVDFTGINKLKPLKVYEKSKLICYTDDTAVLYSISLDKYNSGFFRNNDTVVIYNKDLAVIYNPENIIFKSGSKDFYYTFIGSSFVFSSHRDFLQIFDKEYKNTVCVKPGSYGKFSTDGLTFY